MLLLLITLYGLISTVRSMTCEEGWRSYQENCYFFSSNTMSWHDALTECQSKGSDLMSILDIHERTWVRTQVGTYIYWIGLNDIAAEGEWEWTDGNMYYPYLSYWKPGQPDNYGDNEDCGQVLGQHEGRWNDEVCTARRRYICKKTDPNPTVRCDTANGWEQYNSNCYKLRADLRKSWNGARGDCLLEGGDLVSITSAEEQQYVTGRLDSSEVDLWIGFSTLKCTSISCQIEPNSTKFTWSDASTSQYTNWGENQPDHSHIQHGICAAMIKEAGDDYGKWKSHLCRHERPYMCKRALNTVCPDGWLSFSGNCYWLVSNINLLTSWHDALSQCSNMGATLLTIKNEEEQFFINGYVPDFHHVEIPDIWIGLSDKDKDGTQAWVDKTALQFTNWADNFPKDTADTWDCGQIFTGNYAGKWETTNCFKNLGYICKMVGGQNVKPTAAPDSHCDQGYLLYGDHCYHFESESVKTWEDAESYCVSQNGHLVSIHNEEQVSFLTAHMAGTSWVGLNDIKKEGDYVWTDGTASDYLPWTPGQPDNWGGNEDCMHVHGPEHQYPGYLNDLPCTATYPFICQKAKGQGPPPAPPTSGPGWTEKCGTWMSDPFNDYCYLFNYLSLRIWSDARADCVNQGGDLLSITEPFEQSFIQANIKSAPTGVSMWMGGHDSINEGGWEWTDGSPFNYIHWANGNPDDYQGEDCLSMLINTGYWNDDDCGNRRGYICKRRGNTPEPPPPHDGFITSYLCQDSMVVLHCPQNSVINIQSAFYGRKSDKICPYENGATGTCTVDGILPIVRKSCDNREFCFVRAHSDTDPCPTISKYMEVVYSCEQNVCLRGLGMEDKNITDAMITASSAQGGYGPEKARLNGDSCWMPSNPTNSYIQVDLGTTRKVTGIVIQGCPSADNWVTEFKIQTSSDGTTWTDYTSDGGVFWGAHDRNTPETQLLGTPVTVHYIRVLPAASNNQAGLRLEILGCTPDYAVLCSSRPNFNHAVDRFTVHCPAGCADQPYEVYGSLTYRGDSTICAAAIHAGVVLNDNGGDCTMLKTPGQSFYSGSTRNGITTKQYDGDYSVSYEFADGELRCSGPDWYEFGEFCYKPYAEKKTWHEARTECRKNGADLVSILSLTEQSWLESYLYMATSDVWIGLNDLTFNGWYLWSDSHEVKFTYWAPGEPNNHQGFSEDCVEILHATGRWNDVTCTELNTFICKMPRAHYPLPSVQPTIYGCQQGWDAFEYSCYWFEETAKTRAEAKAFCEAKDSTLLHILDVYEQAHFTALLSGYSDDWWIGLRAGGEDAGVDYKWDNGAALTYTNWDRNQPDSSAGNCVTMTTETPAGFWNNMECELSKPFICEGPRDGISPPTKAPTPPPVSGCESGWSGEPHFRYCYKLFTVDYALKKSWAAAREDCVSRGADLVSIHNYEEEIFLSTYSKGKTKWIGLQHNAVEGGYQWSDGTPVSHTNWGKDEPNNHGGRENCVEMVTTINGSSWWNDLNCDAHQDWICMIAKGKKPIVPPAPPSPEPAPDCGSNPGWRKNNGICYYYNDTDIVDFHTAATRCYNEKARLVSINDEHEQLFVVSLVGTGQVSAAWIGMRMIGTAGGEYIWLDHSPITYVHWAPGEPNNANGEEQCVQMNRYPGTWNDANCGRATAGYVCKKLPGEDHTHPPPTTPWTGYCPEGWMLFGSKCYIFKGNHHDQKEVKANWTYARDWCKKQGGDLAVIDTQYENDFVSSYLKDLVLPVWIGLSDTLHESKFAWSDGSPVLYTNWADKEPNNNDGQEHCAAMTHNHLVTGRWNDDKCDEERGWVCYMKKSSSISPAPTKSPCPSDYIPWYNNCYKFVEDPKTWEESQAACEKEGGNLASVDMSYEQAFIAGAVQKGKSDAWIGLRRKEDSNSYKWSDGWPVFFTHWGPGEPTSHKGEGCVSMHAPAHFIHGTWNDTACDQAKPYICKITKDKPPSTPAPGDGKCWPGFWAYGRYCYFVYNGQQGFSWPEARSYCQLLKGADLVSIHSRAEVEFIRNMNYTKYHNVWIGLTRDGSLGWGWTDMSAVSFLNWAPGEPNEAGHSYGEEDCVEMYNDGTWNDNNCLQKRGFACRHPQYYHTDDNGNIVLPTEAPSGDAGVIAGAVIGAIVFMILIVGLLYYVFSVRGVKLSEISFPRGESKNIDVPTFSNPNFGDDSES